MDGGRFESLIGEQITLPTGEVLFRPETVSAAAAAYLSALVNAAKLMADAAAEAAATAQQFVGGALTAASVSTDAGSGTRLSTPINPTTLDILPGALGIADSLIKLLSTASAPALSASDQNGRMHFGVSQTSLVAGPVVAEKNGSALDILSRDLSILFRVMPDGIGIPGQFAIKPLSSGSPFYFCVTDMQGRVIFGIGPDGIVTAGM